MITFLHVCFLLSYLSLYHSYPLMSDRHPKLDQITLSPFIRVLRDTKRYTCTSS